MQWQEVLLRVFHSFKFSEHFRGYFSLHCADPSGLRLIEKIFSCNGCNGSLFATTDRLMVNRSVPFAICLFSVIRKRRELATSMLVIVPQFLLP